MAHFRSLPAKWYEKEADPTTSLFSRQGEDHGLFAIHEIAMVVVMVMIEVMSEALHLRSLTEKAQRYGSGDWLNAVRPEHYLLLTPAQRLSEQAAPLRSPLITIHSILLLALSILFLRFNLFCTT
jgi:hypothetical protein